MTGHGQHARHDGGDGDPDRRGRRADRPREAAQDSPQERERRDQDARVGQSEAAEDRLPTPEGLTSPGEGLDDAPAEPRQSKDYA
jgi:hypothetical protein